MSKMKEYHFDKIEEDEYQKLQEEIRENWYSMIEFSEEDKDFIAKLANFIMILCGLGMFAVLLS